MSSSERLMTTRRGCPFCDREARLRARIGKIRTGGVFITKAYVYCSYCGARGPIILNRDRDTAVSDALYAWEVGPEVLRANLLRRDKSWLLSAVILAGAVVQVAQLQMWGRLWVALLDFLSGGAT